MFRVISAQLIAFEHSLSSLRIIINKLWTLEIKSFFFHLFKMILLLLKFKFNSKSLALKLDINQKLTKTSIRLLKTQVVALFKLKTNWLNMTNPSSKYSNLNQACTTSTMLMVSYQSKSTNHLSTNPFRTTWRSWLHLYSFSMLPSSRIHVTALSKK